MNPGIELQPVESSNIEAVGHDAATNTLHVRFKSGATYHLANVTPEQHQAMISADSIGSHYHKNFRGNRKHPATKAE